MPFRMTSNGPVQRTVRLLLTLVKIYEELLSLKADIPVFLTTLNRTRVKCWGSSKSIYPSNILGDAWHTSSGRWCQFSEISSHGERQRRCDPIWHVNSQSSEGWLQIAILCLLYLYLYGQTDRQKNTGIKEIERSSQKHNCGLVESWDSHKPRDIIKSWSDTD